MKKTLSILTLSTFSGAALTFAIQVFLARILPQSEFGAFYAALSLVTLIAPFAGFGVGSLMLKVFGEEGWAAIRWLRPALNFTVFSCIAALILVLIFGLFFERDELSSKVLYLLSLIIISQALFEYSGAIFQLEGKYNKLSLLHIAPHAMRFFLVFLLYLTYGDALNAITIAQAYLFIGIIIAAIGWTITNRATQGNLSLVGHTKQSPSSYQDRLSAITIFKQAWPFVLAGVFYLIYFQSNIILVKYMLGNESAAQYSVAVTIMAGVYILPSVIYQKFLLPNIHIWANHNTGKLKTVYHQGNIAMLAIGTITSISLIAFSKFFIVFLFEKNYIISSDLVAILALGVPFGFISANIGAMLTPKNNMKIKVNCMGLAAIFNVILTMILIMQYGLIGAAYASVATELFLLILYFVTTQKFVFKGIH